MTATTISRTWAIQIVQQLRAAGYQALLAGGCVRDQLLGTEPKDYDVATNATPDQIQQVFRRQKTLAIGAAFGVIAVVGSRQQGTVEVATFRQDLGYSDGRRPDGVAFCTAEEDAQRRDFTINGMFWDPLNEQILDYVGGQADLAQGIIRAIGDPVQRFTEDKLRLLRAVRFTARFGFALDAATKSAIMQLAPLLTQVSAERISDELHKLMLLPRRAQGWQLLLDTGLLEIIWPEWRTSGEQPIFDREAHCRQIEAELAQLSSPDFPLTMAICLAPLPALMEQSGATDHVPPGTQSFALRLIHMIGRRLKWSNDEIAATAWLVEHQAALLHAPTQPWSRIQPLLIHPQAANLVTWTALRQQLAQQPTTVADWCRDKLALPPEELNPPLLISGKDLIKNGHRPGDYFSRWLTELRTMQLDQQLTTVEQAWAWIASQNKE